MLKRAVQPSLKNKCSASRSPTVKSSVPLEESKHDNFAQAEAIEIVSIPIGYNVKFAGSEVTQGVEEQALSFQPALLSYRYTSPKRQLFRYPTRLRRSY